MNVCCRKRHPWCGVQNRSAVQIRPSLIWSCAEYNVYLKKVLLNKIEKKDRWEGSETFVAAISPDFLGYSLFNNKMLAHTGLRAYTDQARMYLDNLTDVDATAEPMRDE